MAIRGFRVFRSCNGLSARGPMLMASFWLNHQWTGDEPYAYHVTNVVLHFLVSVIVALIAMRLVEWAGGIPKVGRPATCPHRDAGDLRGRSVSGASHPDRIRGLRRQPL